MKNRLNRIVNATLPYIALGVAIIILIALFIVFSYLLLLGCIVGFIFYVVMMIKRRFFAGKQQRGIVIQHGYKRKTSSNSATNDQYSGRTYEHKN